MPPKKKVAGFIKLQIQAGQATPAPPVGPALGQHGVNIMEFVKAYNAATEAQRGNVIPVEITVYEDRSFTFVTKTPPAAELIKKAAGVQKGSGEPHKTKVAKLSRDQVLEIARNAAPKMGAGGTLIFMGGTGGRKISREGGIVSAATAALPPFVATLALEVAPVRANLIAAGFVDTPLSASLLGDQLDERRAELRAKLPIGRVVGPEDVAALAVHIMSNTALTGATYDIDGGQQLVSS